MHILQSVTYLHIIKGQKPVKEIVQDIIPQHVVNQKNAVVGRLNQLLTDTGDVKEEIYIEDDVENIQNKNRVSNGTNREPLHIIIDDDDDDEGEREVLLKKNKVSKIITNQNTVKPGTISKTPVNIIQEPPKNIGHNNTVLIDQDSKEKKAFDIIKKDADQMISDIEDELLINNNSRPEKVSYKSVGRLRDTKKYIMSKVLEVRNTEVMQGYRAIIQNLAVLEKKINDLIAEKRYDSNIVL